MMFTRALIALSTLALSAVAQEVKGIGASPLGFVTVSGVPGSIDLGAAGIAGAAAQPTPTSGGSSDGELKGNGGGIGVSVVGGFSSVPTNAAATGGADGVLGVSDGASGSQTAAAVAGTGDPSKNGIGAKPLGGVSSSAIKASKTDGVLGVSDDGSSSKAQETGKGGSKTTTADKSGMTQYGGGSSGGSQQAGSGGGGGEVTKTVTVTKTVSGAECTQGSSGKGKDSSSSGSQYGSGGSSGGKDYGGSSSSSGKDYGGSSGSSSGGKDYGGSSGGSQYSGGDSSSSGKYGGYKRLNSFVGTPEDGYRRVARRTHKGTKRLSAVH